MIDKHLISSDIKSYYKIALTSLQNIIVAKVNSVNQLEFNTNNDSSQKQSLIEIMNYYEFLESEMPRLNDKWDSKKNKRK